MRAFFPIRDNSHLLVRIILIPSFNERTTGRESLELMKRFLFLMIMFRQKILHFEELRAADILDWAARDPAFRRSCH